MQNSLCMPEHRMCPHCGAQNLTGEIICFACGEPLGQRPRPRERAPTTPWFFYLGGLAALALGGMAAYYLALALSGFRRGASIPAQDMVAAAVVLALIGQWGFYSARRGERSYWDLKRAPQLPLAQAEPGDAVWLRGAIVCKAPLTVPYGKGEQCVYLATSMREQGGLEWPTATANKQVVPFLLQDGEASISAPGEGMQFDEIPVYIDTRRDDGTEVLVRALLVGWKASICCRVAGEGRARWVEPISPTCPALVTWQYRDSYIAAISKGERSSRRLGWVTSVLAAIIVLATCVKM